MQGVTTDTSHDLLGDADLSGEIDIIDATMIQRRLVGLATFSERQERLADTNRNGETDIIDATYIQRYLVGLIDAF